ncbi:hypothetical protein PanWU01x14_302160 [Parasponia andersonii]|uniref:Uncharacterized protein n=1 Tax=Parasponia andersonii TaxID=3476 RepID=A0A2P5ATB8_PARAD|nr:hypothetical protein PanWU01x14_302160 [Parasponia andersonii]
MICVNGSKPNKVWAFKEGHPGSIALLPLDGLAVIKEAQEHKSMSSAQRVEGLKRIQEKKRERVCEI